jgi:hypothetical protein
MDLPPELIIYIFHFISPIDLLLSTRTSKKWKGQIIDYFHSLPHSHFSTSHLKFFFLEKKIENNILLLNFKYKYEVEYNEGKTRCRCNVKHKEGITSTFIFGNQNWTNKWKLRKIIVPCHFHDPKQNSTIYKVKFCKGMCSIYIDSYGIKKTRMFKELFEFSHGELWSSGLNYRKKRKDPSPYFSRWLKGKDILFSFFSYDKKIFKLNNDLIKEIRQLIMDNPS